MNTGDWLVLLGALAGGAVLGVLFFGGLFWTTEHVVHCKWPQAVLVASLFTRVAIVIAGFYWLMAGAPVRGLAALAGFIVARSVLVRVFGSTAKKKTPNEAH